MRNGVQRDSNKNDWPDNISDAPTDVSDALTDVEEEAHIAGEKSSYKVNATL